MKKWIIFALIAIFLVSASEYRYEVMQKNNEKIISGLSAELDSANDKLRQTEENNQQLIDDVEKLRNNLDMLNSSLQHVQDSYSKLNTDFRDLKDEAYGTIDQIDEFETELVDSLDWFNSNSQLSGITNENRIKNSLTGRCWDIIDDSCYVKLGCFFFVNYKLLGLRYKYDTATSNEPDKLQSLAEFVTNYGGDCEDYSLFYKAEYNYVLKKCYEQGTEKLQLEAWTPAQDQYWLDTQEQWYMDRARARFLPDEDIYPSVVCGNIHDPGVKMTTGHCAVVFTKHRIMNISDVRGLEGSLVEPQNGRYLGTINSYAKVAVDKKADNTIWMIITDDDLFLFSENLGWKSYSTLHDDLDRYRTELIAGVFS